MGVATIDLIPTTYREEIHARRVLKWYVPVFLTLLCGIGGARIVLGLERAALEGDLEALHADISFDAEQQRRFDELAVVRDTLQRRLGVLDSLRGGLPADRMFAAIDQAANEDTWFRRWTFRRSGEVVRQAPEAVHTGYLIVIAPAGAGGEEQAWRLDTHMEISGSALDHSAIARFVERLQHHADIADARILRTSSRREGQHEIIDFDLAVSVSSGEA